MKAFIVFLLITTGFGAFIYLYNRLFDAIWRSLSRWDGLSRAFPDSMPVSSQRDCERSDMRVGNWTLEEFIQVDITATGLRVFPRIARPPIFIPWSQIESIAPGKVIVRHSPSIHLFLPAGGYERIRGGTPNIRFPLPDEKPPWWLPA
jgi:hypothetical protein